MSHSKKFKVGDRITFIKPWLKNFVGKTVTVTSTNHWNGNYIFTDSIEVYGWISPDFFILESVYKSKLYKAMN